jgi:hypothetical protein
MAGLEPSLSGQKKSKPSALRVWLLAVLQALGMGMLAWACAVGSMALFVGLPSALASSWWTHLPGWIVLIWLSKKAAVSGWWTVRSAKVFCAALGIFATVLSIWFGSGVWIGWVASGLWACLWPKARKVSLDKALKDQALKDRSLK